MVWQFIKSHYPRKSTTTWAVHNHERVTLFNWGWCWSCVCSSEEWQEHLQETEVETLGRSSSCCAASLSVIVFYFPACKEGWHLYQDTENDEGYSRPIILHKQTYSTYIFSSNRVKLQTDQHLVCCWNNGPEKQKAKQNASLVTFLSISFRTQSSSCSSKSAVSILECW